MSEPKECEVCGGFPPCECWDLCVCGDYRSEHDPLTGRSNYNFECQKFVYDEDGTLMALACPVEGP